MQPKTTHSKTPQGSPQNLVTAKIPVRDRNLLAYFTVPLLWFMDYLEQLRINLESMIWDELIHNKADYDQSTNLIAFAVFTVFCLFAYYEEISDYLVYFLFALWPLEILLAWLSFKSLRYDFVSLTLQDSTLLWKCRKQQSGSAKKQIKQRTLDRHEIRKIVLRLVADQKYKRRHAWSIFMELSNNQSLILYHSMSLQQSLHKAMNIAEKLRIPLTIKDSEGSGLFVDSETEASSVLEQQGVWKLSSTPQCVTLQKNLTNMDAAKIFRSLFSAAGTVLFLAIVAGIMVRYGMFLCWWLGPHLGLVESVHLHFDLSLDAIVSFFMPDWDFVTMSVLLVAIVSILISIWNTGRRQKIQLDTHKIRYQLGTRNAISASRATSPQLLMINEPKPMLLVISSNKSILLENVYDTEELEELYVKLKNSCKMFENKRLKTQ